MDFKIVLLFVVIGCAKGQVCNKADLAFLLDESSSIQPIPFGQIKQFVFDVMDGVNVGRDTSHVSVMMFSDEASFLFRFNIINYQTVDKIKQLLQDRQQIGGSTHTYKGLDLLRRVGFSTSYGARTSNDVAKIVIVVTDGNSQLPDRTKETAKKLRKERKVHVFAIGVGNDTSIRQEELENIASDKQSVFRVSNAAGLDRIKGSISGAACRVIEEEEEEEEVAEVIPPTEPPFDEDYQWVPTEGPPEDYIES